MEQVRNEENNREYRLYLTEKGWEIFEGHNQFEQACYRRSFGSLARFSEADFQTYIQIQKCLNETFALDVEESRNIDKKIT